MNEQYFNIIQALCRCAMFNATDATKHQIDKLGIRLLYDGHTDQAAVIHKLLNPDPDEISDMKIERS